MPKKESQVEKSVVATVKAAGGIAYKFSSPAHRSVPDRLCVLPGGHVCFVECKAPGKKATNAQQKEHERLRSIGAQVNVIDFEVGSVSVNNGNVQWYKK